MPHQPEKQPSDPRDTAYAGGGTGPGTGGRYDEKRDPPFPEDAPAYLGHAATDFDASRQGEPPKTSVPVTDSGVSNADVDEFTTGGNSPGQNAGASRDERKSG